jgi:hypothetical protein
VGKKCSNLEWKYYKHGDEVILPDDTAAMLIEVSGESAQLRLFRHGSTIEF